MKTVIMLMVFAIPPNTQPVRPHEVLRFHHMEECQEAKWIYRKYSDGWHGYECVPGVVVD